mmetsp:Transcript_60927/g.176259  ORF Transcript_60927/g.176259 Transcript_60927/m.176259 type:complete len:315 (+) Transcript_60927:134-1078(+)
MKAVGAAGRKVRSGLSTSSRRWCGLQTSASSDAGFLGPTSVPETPPPLPVFPEAVARERKRLISAAVAGAPKGAAPIIPPNGYLEEEHMMWRAIYRNVSTIARQHACPQYQRALFEGAAYREDAIPDMAELQERCLRTTGWRISPCCGSVPPRDFFVELAERNMPCTMYIRPHTKLTFTEDPDCIHEMLGHIPHLFIPSWSRMYEAFGRTARRLTEKNDEAALEKLILMYFAVVEKGLVHSGANGEVQAIGASVISGAGELQYAMREPERYLPLTVDNVLKYGSTDEDGFMKRYFVGKDVDSTADFVIQFMDTL